MKYLTCFVLIITMVSCAKINSQRAKQQLLDIDNAFSKQSETLGLKKSFSEYADENAVLIRSDKTCIKGKKAIESTYQTMNDKNLVLRWKPAFSDVSQSGDLGYTYGTYQLVLRSEKGEQILEGSYTTVWKKQQDGSWKWTLNTCTM